MARSFTAAATFASGFSQKNSGLWTPTMVSPLAADPSCPAPNSGTTVRQLIHPPAPRAGMGGGGAFQPARESYSGGSPTLRNGLIGDERCDVRYQAEAGQ